MNTPVKILIVDDHPAVREGLATRVAQCADMTICAEASGFNQALSAALDHQPDIIIVDISLADGDGLDLVKQLKERDESARILVWSMHPEKLYAAAALRAGARGYIDKQQAMNVIIDAIRDVVAGKLYVGPETREMLLRRAGEFRNKASDNPAEILTEREFEVFRMIGEGRKTADIAAHLNVSIKTIETHRDRMKKKLGVADGTELLHRAILWATKAKT